MNADAALKELIEGNYRYVQAATSGAVLDSKKHQVLPEQNPMAVILGCSDSRVPAELVFDQGVGDLFVIRIAGNIVAPSQIGSIEFACQQFKTQLVVVLGHTNCGAISATIDSLLSDPDQMSPNLASIVDRLKPAVSPVINDDIVRDRSSLMKKAMQANIEYSTQQLQIRSKIIRDLINNKQLKIVGAEYSIETGEVEFYT